MKKTVLIILSCSIFLACSKSDSSSSSNNYSNLIVGKWTFTNQVTWWTPSGSTTIQKDTAIHAGEYADVRTDGKVYSYYWSKSLSSYINDTANYSINNSDLIRVFKTKSDTLQIQTLTLNNLVLHRKNASTGGTLEYWANLTK